MPLSHYHGDNPVVPHFSLSYRHVALFYFGFLRGLYLVILGRTFAYIHFTVSNSLLAIQSHPLSSSNALSNHSRIFALLTQFTLFGIGTREGRWNTERDTKH